MRQRLERYGQAARVGNAAAWAAQAAAGSVAWSAGFISFVMQEARSRSRAPDLFRQSAGHATYIHAALNNRNTLQLMNPFWLFDLPQMRPEVGDLVCKNRANGNLTFAHLPAGFFRSHVDVVIEVDAANNRIFTVGGNVNNTVFRREVRTTNGFVTQNSVTNAGGRYFAILRVRTGLFEGVVP